MCVEHTITRKISFDLELYTLLKIAFNFIPEEPTVREGDSQLEQRVIDCHGELATLRCGLLFLVYVMQFGCSFENFHGSVTVSPLHSEHVFAQDDQQLSGAYLGTIQVEVGANAQKQTCEA